MVLFGNIKKLNTLIKKLTLLISEIICINFQNKVWHTFGYMLLQNKKTENY